MVEPMLDSFYLIQIKSLSNCNSRRCYFLNNFSLPYINVGNVTGACTEFSPSRLEYIALQKKKSNNRLKRQSVLITYLMVYTLSSGNI